MFLKRFKHIIIGLLAVFAAFTGYAQTAPPEVTARFDADSVMIGDQFHLDVEVTRDIMQITEFPVFENDYFAGDIEILQDPPVDTLSQEGRTVKLRKRYLMTCFEEGIMRMGPYPLLYIDKNTLDTIWSPDSLGITVHTFQIDTAAQTIYDIKAPLKAPLKFGEISGYLLGVLLALAVLGFIIWYLIKHGKNKQIFVSRKVIEPPHVVAIRELERVHAQKLWQSGKHKQYYTRITDILREYMERRYKIMAMEMTTDEILERVREFELTDRYMRILTDILRTSDLVKFAKYIPEPDQNESVYNEAYVFIEDTKDITPEVVIETERPFLDQIEPEMISPESHVKPENETEKEGES